MRLAREEAPRTDAAGVAQLAEMASKLPPGMPLHVRMPPEEENAAGPGGKGPPGQGGRGAGGPGGKDQSIMKRLKSMLP